MRSLLSTFSILIARMISLTLRATETSLPSSMFFATCWVIVEAPIGRRPWPYWRASVIAARSIATGSTPRWVKKFWSSAETKACFTISGIAV